MMHLEGPACHRLFDIYRDAIDVASPMKHIQALILRLTLAGLCGWVMLELC